MLNGSGLGKVDFGNVEVEAVGLSDGLDGDAAGVILDIKAVSKRTSAVYQLNAEHNLKTYRGGKESSESHFD